MTCLGTFKNLKQSLLKRTVDKKLKIDKPFQALDKGLQRQITTGVGVIRNACLEKDWLITDYLLNITQE